MCSSSIVLIAAMAALGVLPSEPALSDGQDRYYVVLFAHQSPELEPSLSHSFATFVHKSRGKVVETKTISWLPASGILEMRRPAEPGINKSLKDSIAWAESRNLEISVIGPYEIRQDLYARAVAHVDRLNDGQFKYKMFDRYTRNSAKNCMHALSDLCEDQGQLDTGALHGLKATVMIARRFARFLVDSKSPVEATELLSELGLTQTQKWSKIEWSVINLES